MKLYSTVYEAAEAEQIIDKSRFIAYVSPAETKEEADAFIASIKKKHKDATHNVPAMVLGDKFQIQWASDDGEPQGTSGQPTLNVFRSQEIQNFCCVVTRYFGGTLLGVGGLVRAYSHAAAIAIEEAGVITYEPYAELELRCGYSEYQKYSVLLSAANAVIDNVEYASDVCVRFAIRETEKESIVKKITETGYGKDIPIQTGARLDYR